MKDNPTKGIPSQLILGGFIIAIGVLFLLDNLNLIEFRSAFSFWPAVFIVFGVVKLLDSTARGGKVLGAMLIGLGAAMTANELGYWHFGLRTAWPLLLVAMGGAVIYKAITGKRMLKGAGMQSDDASSSIVDITAILGGFERRVNTPNFRGGEVTAMMGGCVLDLRGSSIEGEAVINVFAAMGGITLKVPVDWTVVLHGTPVLGGFDEKTSTPPNDSKRLIVTGYAIMGGVEIRN
ncbi:MAG: DUF5668 domain-containing protein [Pseudomonadota bacterium]